MTNHGKVPLHCRQQFIFRAATQDLAQEGSSGFQHFTREIERGLAQGHDAKVIGMAVARGMPSHVGKHNIGFLSGQRLLEKCGGLGVEKIRLENDNARNRIHAMHVEGEDAASTFLGLDALGGDLRPAPRGRSEINHPHAGPQNAILVVDLRELEGRARSQAQPFRLMNKGIIQLTFEPVFLGRRAPLGGFNSNFQRAAGALRHHSPP